MKRAANYLLPGNTTKHIKKKILKHLPVVKIANMNCTIDFNDMFYGESSNSVQWWNTMTSQFSVKPSVEVCVIQTEKQLGQIISKLFEGVRKNVTNKTDTSKL